MSGSRPDSGPFWNAYLNYNDIPATENSKVWDRIAGSIGESYGPNSNSCAARVSYGLNYGGAPISVFSAASLNLPDHVYKGTAGDGKRYIVSAMQMAVYLRSIWGAPDNQVTAPDQLKKVVDGLGGACAIFATPTPPGGKGHSGALKSGYSDPYVFSEIPVDVWVLS